MNNMAKPMSVTVRFSHEDIFRGDVSRLIALFNPRRLERGDYLQALMGCLDIVLEPFGTAAETAAAMPAITAFCKKLRAKFPHMGFFCSLETPYYLLNSYCALPSFRVTRDQSGRTRLLCNHAELCAFLREESFQINEFCMKAGMPPSAIVKRSHCVRDYFKLGMKAGR